MKDQPSSEGASSKVRRAKKARPHLEGSDTLLVRNDLKLTHTDKILWPEDGYTKGDLILYYDHVTQWILPYLKGRPLTVQRYPNGIEEGSFFEKNAPAHAPSWLETITLPSEGKRSTVRYPLCNDGTALLYFANLAAITFHVWMSHVGSLDEPDYVLFDLDPWEGCSLTTLASVAVRLRGVLGDIGLNSLVKTSGGEGLHVIVPLRAGYSYDDAKQFAEIVARHIASLEPEKVTLERMTAKRKAATVYVDYLQVGKGKTIVPPYSARARPGAPVSMPLEWSEIERMQASRAKGTLTEFGRWTIANVPKILEQNGDLWRTSIEEEQALLPALNRARKVWEMR